MKLSEPSRAYVLARAARSLPFSFGNFTLKLFSCDGVGCARPQTDDPLLVSIRALASSTRGHHTELAGMGEIDFLTGALRHEPLLESVFKYTTVADMIILAISVAPGKHLLGSLAAQADCASRKSKDHYKDRSTYFF